MNKKQIAAAAAAVVPLLPLLSYSIHSCRCLILLISLNLISYVILLTNLLDIMFIIGGG